jgi:hypothetical protein
MNRSSESRPQPRWYHFTPDRLLTALLPAVGLLWLSERYRWFPFNEHKNWTVLIAIAVVLAAIVLLLLWFGVSLVFRLRFQFGIRSLLVLTFVLAVVGSWFAVRVGQARRQANVVEALREARRRITYDYETDDDGPFIDSAISPGPAWLEVRLGGDFLSDVVTATSSYEDDDEYVCRVSELRKLRILHLANSQVTDGGLVYLSRTFWTDWKRIRV